MRVSAYDLREAMFNPAHRLPPPGVKRPPMISPTGSLRRAVRVFHDSGETAARAALRESLSNYFSQPGRPTTQAGLARQALDIYIRLADADPRDAFVPHGRVDATLGTDTVAADVDVVLLDPDGYVGRVLLFGPTPQPLTETQLEIVAYAPVVALTEEFDDDRVLGVDVWEIRRERIAHVPVGRALAQRETVRQLIDRIRP